MRDDMRCWWCGVQPDDVLDITRLGDLEGALLEHIERLRAAG